MADNTDPTGIYTVARQDLSSQTEVSATLGYAGSFSIAAPSGASAQEVAQAQQTVTEDQQTLSADEQVESDKSNADNQAIAAAQTNVNTDRSTLSSDQANAVPGLRRDGGVQPACSQDAQKVSQDQTQLTQATPAAGQRPVEPRPLTTTRTRPRSHSDQTKLQGDQATLASLQATAVNPGTTYTSLPKVGDVIKRGPARLLAQQRTGAAPLRLDPRLPGVLRRHVRRRRCGRADRRPDRPRLRRRADPEQPLLLGHRRCGRTLADARSACRRPAQILLGQVVFEPGPIRVTSVTPSVGGPSGAVAAAGLRAGAGGGGWHRAVGDLDHPPGQHRPRRLRAVRGGGR